MKLFIKILKWPFARFSRLSLRGKVITLVVALLLIFWRVNAYKNSGLKVDVATAHSGKLVETIDASGEVVAQNSASLSFRTAGEVTELNFKEGDEVKKGDVIAKLDTTIVYSAYQQADATLRAAQAALNYTYDTLQGKETTESFSEISTRTAAEATKDKAYWAYVAALDSLNGAYIRAPFDGILTYVPDNIVPGAYVSLPSSAAFQVVGPETTYFEAQVNEVDIHKLTSGAAAKINIDSFPGETFDGIVSGYNFTSTKTSTGGTAYNATITLPENNNLKFKPGMNGDVEIIISESENVLLVPITAVVEEQGKTYVWKVEKDKATKTEVTTGKSSTDEIEITSGLTDGQKIVSRPPSKIQEGAKLKVSS